MTFRRAIWAEDSTVTHCTKCRSEFRAFPPPIGLPKHHCRRCGLIFCAECSKSKMIVPQEELVPRPPPPMWVSSIASAIVSDEDNFR